MSRSSPAARGSPHAPDTLPPSSMPDAVMPEEDRVRLLRLLRRTLGSGFKLAFVEAATARDRQAVLEWLAPALRETGARAHELNLRDHRNELVSESFNLWALLHRHVPPESLDRRSVLMLSGVEEVMYRGRTDRSELLQQINVQRDLLVRDYPCWWLVFIHPESRQRWYSVAPDFCDLASIWIEAPRRHGEDGTAIASPSLPESGHYQEPPAKAYGLRGWPPLLSAAAHHLLFSRYAEALDAINSFRAAVGGEQHAEPRGPAIADMLEAAALARRGDPKTALLVLREKVIPTFERLEERYLRALAFGYLAEILEQQGETEEALRIRRQEELPVYEDTGDEYARAVTMGQIADLLQQRGEIEEALRIHLEEELPVHERLANVRERAITMGKIADILELRGEAEEALRIRREEELPGYERVGDARSRAVTMGKIADILQQRGETNEALRIYVEEQLPVFEQLGTLRDRAVLMGRIADILQERGETEEALRIRREEQLPVFERLGDARSRAVTLARIANVLRERGETEEALRIYLEECLPVAERIVDPDLLAHIRFSCAQIRLDRDGLEGEETETILRELSESFAIYEKLQRADSIAYVGWLLGPVLVAVGRSDEALGVLDRSAAAFEKLQQLEQAARVRELQRSIAEEAHR